jgi:MFS family permease
VPTPSWERLSALTGPAFVVLIVLAVLVGGRLPDADAPVADVQEFFSDRTGVLAGIFLRFFAGFAFLWFAGTLRSALARAEGETARLANVAFGAALVFLAAGMAANVALAAGSFRADELEPSLAGALLTMVYFAYAAGGFAIAWLLAATFVVVLRTGVFPAAVGWAAATIAVVALVLAVVLAGDDLFLVGHWLFLAWVVAVSVLLLRQPLDERLPG